MGIPAASDINTRLPARPLSPNKATKLKESSESVKMLREFSDVEVGNRLIYR